MLILVPDATTDVQIREWAELSGASSQGAVERDADGGPKRIEGRPFAS